MADRSYPATLLAVTAAVVVLGLAACSGSTNRPIAGGSATTLTPTSGPSAPGSGSSTPSPPASTPVTTPAPTSSEGAPLDPTKWSSRRLAAELVMTGAKMGDAVAIKHGAAVGVGGVVLFGPSSRNLARTLRRAMAVAPKGNHPLIASDEEGGQVQRLKTMIYPLPSAETMGLWSASKITATAHQYGLRMRALGVTVALGPDADIAVPGYFIADAHRSFSAVPQRVGEAVNAWNDGLSAAGVLGVVKHWPGHGQASDTHVGASSVPPWSVLKKRDLIPFDEAFAQHVGAVMVGHLRVPGLTEGVLPASESPAAMRALRVRAGSAPLIVTDDLSMAAASTALGVTGAQAAVRSLVAGVDVAMVCWSPVDRVISAVARAIDNGQLPRDQAVASARRVLKIKAQMAKRS